MSELERFNLLVISYILFEYSNRYKFIITMERQRYWYQPIVKGLLYTIPCSLMIGHMCSVVISFIYLLILYLYGHILHLQILAVRVLTLLYDTHNNILRELLYETYYRM